MILTNCKIVLRSRVVEGSLYVNGDKIEMVSDTAVEGIDCGGLLVGPGFIDTHCHGGANKWFFDDPQAAADFHLQHGTTSILASLWRNAGKDGYENAVRHIAETVSEGSAPNLIGIHMEGPYLDKDYGSEGGSSHPISFEEYAGIIEAADGLIKQWTFDPLQCGAEDFAAACYDKDINLGICYSKAAPDDIAKFKRFGLKIGNHIMCGSGKPETRFAGTIEAGSDEYVLANDDMYAELICDSMGAHVRHENIIITYKSKGAGRIMLVTDYCADGDTLGSDVNIINGELYGSKLTMNVACHNMREHTGAPLPEIFRMASATAASALGIKDRGSIKKGALADLVICDEDFNVFGVIKSGNFVRKDF
jgi:N-acetylglucosamine-6-phosphate deacetylase